jgi:hypothetical protein
VFDPISGLTWERKTDDGSIHDKDDRYTWSTGSPWKPDGTAFTVFLAALNRKPCFAGYCDWRLPTIDELQSLNEAPSGGCGTPSLPCYSIPGATAAEAAYWSTSDGFTHSPDQVNAWFTDQRSTYPTPKNGSGWVRAVRGGVSPAASGPAPRS